MSPLNPIHHENPFLWTTVVLSLILFTGIIFWAGKLFGKRRMRLRFFRLFNNHVQPGQVFGEVSVSPTEDTPLTGPEAWQSQTLHAPDGYEDDEFEYFEAKLARPLLYKFPKISSACEKFSGIDRSIELDKALYPHKNSLSFQTPDEYQAVMSIKALQNELNSDIIYINELQRSLTFLIGEQRGSSSQRSKKIRTGIY
jgi:hypothetical protein